MECIHFIRFVGLGYARGNKHEETHCRIMQAMDNGKDTIVYFNVLLLFIINVIKQI